MEVLVLCRLSSLSLGGVLELNEPHHEKTYLKPYANNKDTDQPAYPRSLISIFVVRSLDSISIDAISKISRLLLSPEAEAVLFESCLVADPQRQVFWRHGSNVAEGSRSWTKPVPNQYQEKNLQDQKMSRYLHMKVDNCDKSATETELSMRA